MATILEMLYPILGAKFPTIDLRFELHPEPHLRVPAANPEVGDLLIWDERNEAIVEAIVEVGELTHRHFSNFDASLSVEERDRLIIDEIIWFLDALFANRVFLLTYIGGAGSSRVIEEGESFTLPAGARVYTWSGPYRGG